MIEVLSIFSQFIIFLLIFSFPFTPKILNDTFKDKQIIFSLIDAHSINIVFFIYFCLFFSFLNIDLKILFKIYLLLSLIFIVFNFKKLNLDLKKKRYIIFFCFFLINYFNFFFYCSKPQT